MSDTSGVCTIPPPSIVLNHHETVQPKYVNNYLIHQKTLGEGSMGCVKLAERYTDSQKYAVKIIARNDMGSPWTLGPSDPKDTPSEREQRTRREMTIMHLLQHPNICRLEDWACENNDYYLFLEYVDGGQLLDYIIRHGKLKEKQARKFARQIVSALDYCHRNAIVHRDLKIENILITRDENIKIIDFGLSNFYSSKSLLNTFCGSLYFAAPELLRARDYTGPEVDVWSFGVVLFVLVSGRVPFDDTSLPVLHQKIKAGIVEYPDHLSRECVDLLSKILQVDPKRRETLAFIQEHQWINKGYHSAINSHVVHRPPLDTIDKDVIQRMNEYGFGAPEDIRERLSQVSYQRRPSYDLPPITTTPKQVSSLRRKPTKNSLDDSYSIDDPLVSVYFLVKERMTLGERQEYNLTPVTRSSSTFSNRSQWNTTLARSKTDRTRQSIPTNQYPESHSLLQRSKSAAKRLGTIFQQQGNPSLEAQSTLSRSQSMRDQIRRIPSFRPSLRKELPVEQSPLEDHLVKCLLSARNETTTVKIENRYAPNYSAHPKSLFRFHHRHLFRVSSPYLMQHLLKLLDLMDIQTTLMENELYTIRCTCLVSDWKKLTGQEQQQQQGNMAEDPLQFTLMIYRARWAGGRLGIKLNEAEEEHGDTFRLLYFMILRCLGSFMDQRAE